MIEYIYRMYFFITNFYFYHEYFSTYVCLQQRCMSNVSHSFRLTLYIILCSLGVYIQLRFVVCDASRRCACFTAYNSGHYSQLEDKLDVLRCTQRKWHRGRYVCVYIYIHIYLKLYWYQSSLLTYTLTIVCFYCTCNLRSKKSSLTLMHV